MPSPAKPLSLDEAYDIYKSGGHIGRTDLFALIIGEIKELKGRMGSVDEAAVADLDNRLSSLETVIGNALTKAEVLKIDHWQVDGARGDDTATDHEHDPIAALGNLLDRVAALEAAPRAPTRRSHKRAAAETA